MNKPKIKDTCNVPKLNYDDTENLNTPMTKSMNE